MQLSARHVIAACIVLGTSFACRHTSNTTRLRDAAEDDTPSGANTTPVLVATYEDDRHVLRMKGPQAAVSELRELTLTKPLNGKVPVDALASRRLVRIPGESKLAFHVTVALAGGEQCRDTAADGATLLGEVPVSCAMPPPPGAAFEFAGFCERGGGRLIPADEAKKRAAVCECKGTGAKPKRFLERDAAAFRDRPEAFAALCRGAAERP